TMAEENIPAPESIKPSSLVSPPPINTEATTITTSLPEITPFIALQLERSLIPPYLIQVIRQ
ncbi:hypothetical protein Tco_0036648, partial [Tanacetum coccineum]